MQMVMYTVSIHLECMASKMYGKVLSRYFNT